MKGIVEGFGSQVSPNFDKCIIYDVKILKELKEAVENLEKKELQAYIEAMKELVDIAKDLPQAMKECGATEKDIEPIVEALASMKNPYTFAFHLGKDILVNG